MNKQFVPQASESKTLFDKIDNKRPFTSVNRRTKVNGASDTLLSTSQNDSNEEID